MRKVLLLVLCTLTAGLLLAGPAVADEASAAPAADAAPLFLNDGCDVNRSVPIEVEPPDEIFAGPCAVSRYCQDGSQIACTGQTTCSSGPGNGGGYVACDGNYTWCPYDPDCNAGYYCKKSSECYCFSYLCACINRKCTCAVGG